MPRNVPHFKVMTSIMNHPKTTVMWGDNDSLAMWLRLGVLAIERFADMSCQPSYPHDDHFHFRFFCTADDITQGCRDSPPMYPWQRERLEEAGVRSRPLAPKRPEAKADIVTHEEARKAAGAMDAEVTRWLDRRQSWIERPHPGRTYCP
jgi:hypothetical protein